MAADSAKFLIALEGPITSTDPPALTNLEILMAKTRPSKPMKPSVPLVFDDDEDSSSKRPRPSLAAGMSSVMHEPESSRASSTQPQQRHSVSRAERRAHEEALRVDSTVFDYDGIYDGMKAAEQKIEAAKKVETEERKPKYIANFLASAQTRRLDRLRAEEKMLQLEREKEGDEFKDKDFFVTHAYEKQMAEVRAAEEEERKRDGEFHLVKTSRTMLMGGLEALRKSKKGPGLSGFYKSMLDENAEKHAAAVAASATSGPSLAVKPPPSNVYEPDADYDPLLAREEAMKAGSSRISAETGKEVEINDEGEVVDKRSLLKAGLNIMKKPKPELPTSLLTSQRKGTILEGPYKSRAVGASAGYQERMDRERQRLAEQMKEDAERRRLEVEERAREEEELARKRREGDDGEAERRRGEARERFLARKRERGGGVPDESKKKLKAT
ncbi:MAG: hypothetical protein TREMPRED_000285 [Tremellales sp. Tagirdzhanova-0007]|nr:MAG: hypothetical protein TREMPRED_000285 [Tremellales sp. Tagirdzhanova-0007]